jgi:hypothetical protein
MGLSYHQVAPRAFTGTTGRVPALSQPWPAVAPGIRHMLVGTFFFSAMSVFAKLAGARLPTMELVLARVVIILIMSWWVIQRLGVHPWGNDKKLLLLRGFAGFSDHQRLQAGNREPCIGGDIFADRSGLRLGRSVVWRVSQSEEHRRRASRRFGGLQRDATP